MSNRLTQIALDFGPEHMAPTPPSGVETESASQPPLRQYIEAAGVVVRFKSYKSTHKPQPDKNTVPPGFTTASEKIAAPPVVKLPAAEPENQLEIFSNGNLFPTEPVTAPPAEIETVAVPTPTVETETIAEPQPIAEPAPEPVIASAPSADPDPATYPIAEPLPINAEPLPKVTQRRAATPKPVSQKPVSPKTPSKRGRKSLKQVAAEADLIEVPTDEVLFSKQYYTMGEVSEMFRVNQSLLRFWETEFDILQPRKNKKGDRYFRPVDIKNLHLIYHLLRQKKYTIEGAKEFLKNNKKADERFEVIQRLQEIRAFLLEWKAQL